jgi:hypothetical protein
MKTIPCPACGVPLATDAVADDVELAVHCMLLGDVHEDFAQQIAEYVLRKADGWGCRRLGYKIMRDDACASGVHSLISLTVDNY